MKYLLYRKRLVIENRVDEVAEKLKITQNTVEENVEHVEEKLKYTKERLDRGLENKNKMVVRTDLEITY